MMYSGCSTPKRYASWALGLCLALSTPTASAEEHILTLKQAVQQVLADSPSLAAARQQAEAWQQRVPQLASLPDPVLSLNVLNLPTNTLSNTQENMTQWQLGFSQAIPFPNKLELRSEIAAQQADVLHLNVDELRLEKVKQVKELWWRIFYLDRALETVQKNQDLLRQLVRIVETKYKVGTGLQQDVLLAQLELSKLLDMKVQLAASRRQQVAALNALLHRNPAWNIDVPRDQDLHLVVQDDESKLWQQALQHRPLLASKQLNIESKEHALDLAKLGERPDFNLGAVYGMRQGSNPANGQPRSDLFSVRLNMTLPWFNQDKHNHEVEEQRVESARAAFEYEDSRDAVRSQVSIALAAYQQAREQTLLFQKGIIPQAKQTVASMRSAYQVNRVDFLNLVRTQITLYNYEIQYWHAFAAAKQAQAQLHRAIGTLEEGEQQ